MILCFDFSRFFLLPISRRRSSDSLFLHSPSHSLTLSQHMHAIYILGLVVINLSRRYILKLRIACNRRTDYMVVPTSTHNNVVISTFFVWSIYSLPTTPVVVVNALFFILLSRHHPGPTVLFLVPLPYLFCILYRLKILFNFFFSFTNTIPITYPSHLHF